MLIIKPNPDNSNNEIKSLNATLDGAFFGYIRFRLRGYIVEITEMIPLVAGPLGDGVDESMYPYLDTVIRALGSWALNHSCYYVECRNPALYPTLGQFRFSMKDGIMQSDLSRILKTCGH
jgi:hypothetical protein